MQLHFDPNLDFQLQAIDSVCDLFRGQEICRTEFTVTRHAGDKPTQMYLDTSGLGIGNRLTLLDDQILANLHDIQLQNGLPPSAALVSGDFTVEMETGTGKTYVYLRTIFELNKRYGFTKFVIVVPSVAIKEGVYKSLQITEAHFKSLYAGVPFDYFLYDSTRLGQVRNFATSPHIQIMVVTVGAINKKEVNNLYKDSEKTGGEKPIDLVRATRPILIVDEPQSVDGGLQGRGKAALEAMHPLCTLRYSATHADKHQMLYRLDAVDAYQRRLVKQIEVASAVVEDAHNQPYLRLLKTENRRGRIAARVELDVQTVTGVQRQAVTVQDGDDLEQTTRRVLYANCRIGDICVARGREYIELRVPGGEQFLRPGQAWGDAAAQALPREMIRRTIREHLDREKRLGPQGIKVLSLFFIDTVAKYRQYDADGRPVKGEYACIFEEEYARAARLPDYHSLFQEVDLTHEAAAVHDGYFSIDKKGAWLDTAENNQTHRDNAERAYNLIMKEKEKLLSFSTPLKFIFSHSALREGWDNPNVFQICTLRDIRTERERRQTIGRGLRLCVNQAGRRVAGLDVNTLTVIATEPYEQFAENLQKEIEADTGIRFGVVEKHQFAAIGVTDANGCSKPLGFEASEQLWTYLKDQKLIDAKGKVQDSLKAMLKANTLPLPEAFNPQREAITQVLKKLAGRLEIKNADERRGIKTRQTVLQSAEFKALWDRIRHKTTYRVRFDHAQLLASCTTALQQAPPVPKTRLQWRKAGLAIGSAGIEATQRPGAATVVIDTENMALPDILTELQDRTQLIRRSLVHILIGSGRLDDCHRNPQQFIERAAEAINRCKRLAVVDGIKYQRLGASCFYAQELFEQDELSGYLKNLLNVQKSVHEQVVYDSDTEAAFARQLELNTAVRIYAKLPGWFTVPTPLGSYNPDWAVLVEQEGAERLYLVVETKAGLFADALRAAEAAKIDCGRAHFEALASGAAHETPARYVVARTLEDVLAGG